MFKSIGTVFSKTFFAFVLLIPGLLIVGYIIYSTIQFEVQTKSFTRAKISYLEANEADTTGKTTVYHLIDAQGNETAIVYNDINISTSSSEGDISLYDSESGVSVFDERRVRFDAKNPTKIFFENHWFGIAFTILFGIIFIFAGYVNIFQINIIKKPRRLVIAFIASCILVIGLSLLTDYIVSFDKANEERFKYEYLAAIFILGGGVLLSYWLWTQKMWREVDIIGNELIFKEYSIINIDRLSGWDLSFSKKISDANEIELTNPENDLPLIVQVKRDDVDWLAINPFIITCKHIDENGKELAFKSSYLWYNPTPFINGNVKVLLHPKNTSFYKVDTSFLPKVEIKISRTSYRFSKSTNQITIS